MKGFVEVNFTKVTVDLLDPNIHVEKCTNMVKFTYVIFFS